MAIYHFHLSYTSRSGSGSAISHAAYMCATEGHDQRTNQTWNYSGKGEELLASGISAKEGTPEWCLDAEKLFNAAEKFEDYIAEKRFRGHKDPEKNAKSLAAKADYLQSCRTSYKVSFALPIEINSKEHLIELSKRLAQVFSDKGLPTLWAIHDKKGNPHLHLQCAIRPIVDGEFSEKKFTINKEKLVEIRKAFADVANAFAREKGYDYVVDHRSFKDRGIDMVPTKHLGPASYHRKEIFQNNHLTNEEIREENVRILLHKPEELIKIVAGKKSLFTRSDVYAELFKRVAGDEKLFAAIHTKLEGMDLPGIVGTIANDNIHESFIVKENIEKIAESYVSKILESNSVIALGNNARGETFYTSKAHKESEDKATVLVDALLNSSAKTPPSWVQKGAIKRAEKTQGFTFSEEQKGAIDHLLSKNRIAFLSGQAGTGKSTVLKPVVDAYQRQGFEVVGAAFQGKIADQLAADLGIEAYTLDSMRHYWDEQRGYKEGLKSGALRGSAKAQVTRKLKWPDARRLTSKHVVIVDEASMISGSLWNELLREVVASGATLRIVGDNNQIKALHGLDIARLIEEKVGSFALTQVVRQRETWMREASSLLNNHSIQDGLRKYYDQDAFRFEESNDVAKQALVSRYLASLQENPQRSQMALAYTNKETDELNGLIRSHLFKDTPPSEQFVFQAQGLGIASPEGPVTSTEHATDKKSAAGKTFNLGERVMFLSNDRTEMYVQTVGKSSSSALKGIKNGTMGTIESFDLKKHTLYVRLEDGRLVGFDTRKYDALTSAYAMTISKSQGKTFDKTFALTSKIDANNLLIMMTRHRDSFEGFVSKEIALDFKGLVSLVKQGKYLGLAKDFNVSAEDERYFNMVCRYTACVQLAAEHRAFIENHPSANTETLQDLWKVHETITENRNKEIGEILANWEQCAPFMRQINVTRERLEEQVGLRDRLLSDVERTAVETIETYYQVSMKARTAWETISETHPGSLATTHPDYGTYLEARNERNELAYQMASLASLYRPFFKVTEQEGKFVTFAGTEYDRRPCGFKAVMQQSEQHILTLKENTFENSLTFRERALFKDLKDYKAALSQFAAAFSRTKQVEETAVTPSVVDDFKQKMMACAATRDLTAYEILSNYEAYEPLMKHLQIKEDKLLAHASAGEIRHTARHYNEAETLETRLTLARQLYKLAADENGRASLSLYPLLKESGVDFNQVKFEHHAAEKGLTTAGALSTLAGLKAAYTDLHTYRQTHREATKEWKVIEAFAFEQVKGVQEKCLEAYNASHPTNRIEWKQLEEKAFASLQDKVSNYHLAKEINTQIQKVVGSDLLPSQTLKAHLETLNQLHTSFQTGRSGYLEIYNAAGNATNWTASRESKINQAHNFVENYNAVLDLLPRNEQGQLLKEHYEADIKRKVQSYETSKGTDRIALATEINGYLELEKPENKKITIGCLKARYISVDSIKALSTLEKLPHDAQNKVEPLLTMYLTAKESFSAIWKAEMAEAEKLFASDKAAANTQFERIESLLDARNPAHKNHGFVRETSLFVDHQLRHHGVNADTVLQYLSGTLSPGHKEESANAAQFMATQTQLLEKRGQELERGLSREECAKLTQEFLTLQALNDSFFTKAMAHISEKYAPERDKFGEIIDSPENPIWTAAAQRNKAALDLVDKDAYKTAFENKDWIPQNLHRIFADAEKHAKKGLSTAKSEENYIPGPWFAEKTPELKKPAVKEVSPPSVTEKTPEIAPAPKAPQQVPQTRQKYDRPLDLISYSELNHYRERACSEVGFSSYVDSLLATQHGRDGKARKGECRYGGSGRVVYTFAGRNAGKIFNHETNQGMDLVKVLMEYGGTNFNGAMEHLASSGSHSAREYLDRIALLQGKKSTTLNADDLKARAQKATVERVQIEKSDLQEKLSRMAEVQKIWEQGKAIEGTNGETYLRKERGIKDALPESIRFLPQGTKFTYNGKVNTIYEGALIVGAVDEHSKVQAIQMTYLDKEGRRALDRDGKKRNKVTYGSLTGSKVILQQGRADQPLYLAEGVETALSVKEAKVEGTICASLGISNLSKQKIQNKDLHILADWDGGYDTATWKTIEKTAEHYKAQGVATTIHTPGRKEDLTSRSLDFNDVLLEKGVDAVRGLLPSKSKTLVYSKVNPAQGKSWGFSEDPKDTLQVEVKRKTLQFENVKSFTDQFRFVDEVLKTNMHSAGDKETLQERFNTLLDATQQSEKLRAQLAQDDPKLAHYIGQKIEERNLDPMKDQSAKMSLRNEAPQQKQTPFLEADKSTHHAQKAKDTEPKQDLVEAYLNLKTASKAGPNFTTLKGEEKEKALEGMREMRRLAFEILQNPEAKAKAETVVPLQELQIKAQNHKERLAQEAQIKTTTGKGVRW